MTSVHQLHLGHILLSGSQACYSCAEFAASVTTPADMHGPDWHSAGLESVARLRSLNAVRAHFSHDTTTSVAN